MDTVTAGSLHHALGIVGRPKDAALLCIGHELLSRTRLLSAPVGRGRHFGVISVSDGVTELVFLRVNRRRAGF